MSNQIPGLGANKITNFAVALYDSGSKWAAAGSRAFRLPQFSAALSRYFSKPAGLVGIEAFVALSLVIYYFFLLLPMAEPVRHYGHDTQTLGYFTAQSHHSSVAAADFAKQYPDVQTRLPGEIITGWLTDWVWNYAMVEGHHYFTTGLWQFNSVSCIFAAYHSFWLLLLFASLVRYRKDALLIILGVFCGLMFNMCWPSWQYFFPWNLPSLCFFTWAILAYDKYKSIVPLMAIVWIGALFKETTLCCALLILLGERWPLKQRLISFIVTIVAFSVAKKFLMAAYAVPVSFLSTGNFFSGLRVVHNFEVTFANPGLNHVIFVNAGALLLMMLLPWRTYRQLLFKLVAVVFITGIWLFGNVIEFRVWYEILPLGWILISEATSRRSEAFAHPGEPATTAFLEGHTGRALKGLGWVGMGLLAMTLVVLLIANFNAGGSEQQPVAATDTQPTLGVNQETQSPLNVDRKEFLNNLAWTLATNPDAAKRDGALAVKLAERACQQTGYKETPLVGTLGAAYAEAGNFDEAIATAQKACALASESGDANLLASNQQLLALYRTHQAYHESANQEPAKP